MHEATHERPAVNPHNIANLAYALTGKSANSGTTKLSINMTDAHRVSTNPRIINSAQPAKTSVDRRFGCSSSRKMGDS